MKIDDITQTSLLYDFYGQLLPKRQREVMELYHEENLTLSEIAEEFGISRQGVHDALKNAEKALHGYEEKLGLVERFEKSSAAVRDIDAIMDSVIERLQSAMDGGQNGTACAPGASGHTSEQRSADAQIVQDLRRVKHIIDNLEE